MTKLYSTFFYIFIASAFFHITSFGQSTDNRFLSGNWEIADYTIEMLRDDINPLNAETVIFSDIISGNSMLSIDAQGDFTFKKDQQKLTGFIEIREQNLWFNYISETGGTAQQTTSPDPETSQQQGNKQKHSISSTIYQFTYTTGKLTITREDPLVKEMYIFIKN